MYPSMYMVNRLLPHFSIALYLFRGRTTFARAATATLCTAFLLSHTPLLPSTTAMSSSEILCAKPPLPLPKSLRRDAALRIHCTAARRRCLTPRGTGICKATPPPAAPLWFRIRMRGATESMARVRYRTGLRGRCDGGGAPGRRGRAGFIVGIFDVRRCWRIRDTVCTSASESMLFIHHYRGRNSSYPLRHTLLTMLHEKISDLVNDCIIPMLQVPVLGKWKWGQPEFDAWDLWCCRGWS